MKHLALSIILSLGIVGQAQAQEVQKQLAEQVAVIRSLTQMSQEQRIGALKMRQAVLEKLKGELTVTKSALQEAEFDAIEAGIAYTNVQIPSMIAMLSGLISAGYAGDHLLGRAKQPNSFNKEVPKLGVKGISAFASIGTILMGGGYLYANDEREAVTIKTEKLSEVRIAMSNLETRVGMEMDFVTELKTLMNVTE